MDVLWASVILGHSGHGISTIVHLVTKLHITYFVKSGPSSHIPIVTLSPIRPL